MFFDMQNGGPVETLFVFPDAVFAALPKQSPLENVQQVQGNVGAAGNAIIGTITGVGQ